MLTQTDRFPLKKSRGLQSARPFIRALDADLVRPAVRAAINELVYKLYGLSDADIRVVEEATL